MRAIAWFADPAGKAILSLLLSVTCSVACGELQEFSINPALDLALILDA
jgi:hypothetical protein